MTLPYFYYSGLQTGSLTLDEDTSRHVISVLRMQAGEHVLLTDGKGHKATATIATEHRKHATVTVSEMAWQEPVQPYVAVAISLLKNTSRFEWFLEKATEIGINEIIPLVCERTEKEKFRSDRLTSILISAMLQSQQCWLPKMGEPVSLIDILKKETPSRYIAHCIEGEEKIPLRHTSSDSIILIGPEGDFTPKEISAALAEGFQPVSLGNTRLRTETAGMVAASLLRLS